MAEHEFIIREPKISIKKRILFSIVFALFFIFVVYIFNIHIIRLFTSGDILRIAIHLILLFLFLCLSFIPIVTRHYIYIDFSALRIKHAFEFGIFKYDEKWQDLNALEYISIFKVNELFQVNMWYEKTKILNLFVTENLDEAIENAFVIANKLHIDLLDATVKGDHKWVDKAVFAETSKIEYL